MQPENFNFLRIWPHVSLYVLKKISEELACPKFRGITDFPFLLHPADGGRSIPVKFVTCISNDTTSWYRSQKSILRPLWEHESLHKISSGPSKRSVFMPAVYRRAPFVGLATVHCESPHCFGSNICTSLSTLYRSQIPDLTTLLAATWRMKTFRPLRSASMILREGWVSINCAKCEIENHPLLCWHL